MSKPFSAITVHFKELHPYSGVKKTGASLVWTDPVVPVDKCFLFWKLGLIIWKFFLFSSSDREMLLAIKPVYSFKSVLEGRGEGFLGKWCMVCACCTKGCRTPLLEDMSWIIEVELLGFSAFQMSPGCPLTLTWQQAFPQRPRFVLVPLCHEAPDGKWAPSELALPSMSLAPAFSSCRRAIFSFLEAFTERMENPFP